MTPKPEARVARFLLGMFRNRFFEAGNDAKVSPEVAKVSPRRGGDDEKVSPSFLTTIHFLTVDFLFWQVSQSKSDWPERQREEKRRKSNERTAGGGYLEKHCGRTRFRRID